ncbi:MAG TPA: hypothetical protein VGK89_02145 [Candidatus Eisenbacteria bacterium]|jgi:hypothetical protein
MNRPGRIAAALFAALLAAGIARAGTEEFSTFDVSAQEEDDESLLDHMLTRPPRAWRDEWEHAAQALRTSQGCLTSGQWFIDTDMKLRSPLGRRARLGVDLRQSESDVSSYDYLDFSFRFPTPLGTAGATFRPLYDKSRQDFGLLWETGADTTAFDSQVVFGLEDMFNNLWAFRQTRVGQASEPYERHPYEPALRLRARGDRWRAEVFGQYLTPSRKRVIGSPAPHHVTLWGTLGGASVEAAALGLTWELRGSNQQARGDDQPVDLSSVRSENWRRRWSAETAIGRAITPRIGAELRALYQSRTQRWAGPAGPGTFDGIDRLIQLDAHWDATGALQVRAGGLYDRIGIAHTGYQPYFTWGTRNESRAYVGLAARFGRVSVEAIEGIELDPEPYEVWLVHDKGFLHLQTTF